MFHLGKLRLGATAIGGALLATALALPASAGNVNYNRLVNADREPQNWLMVHGTYDAKRFSALDQINRDNVKDLRVSWAFPLGGTDRLTAFGGATNQGNPLVEDGFMYVANGWGTVFKLDIRDGKQGKIVWMFDPGVDSSGVLLAINRGLGLWKDKVILSTLDARLIAINTESGEVDWETSFVHEDRPGEFFDDAPLVVDGMIIVGQSAGDLGTRGWIVGVDAETGAEVWRFNTVPTPGDPGSETWLDDHNAYLTGGGGIWLTGSYDPESRLTYWGTGNPAPMYDPEFRPGDNLYTDSLVALNTDTGNLDWYFQYTPGDYLDYDEIGIHLLYDTEIDGVMRKVVGHFGRNGFYYNLDRVNGEFISANQYVNELNWTDGIDPKTGKPLGYNPQARLQEYKPGFAPRRGRAAVLTCPNIQGGVNQWPTSFNPDLGIAYGAGIEGCSEITNEPMDEEKDYRNQLLIGGNAVSLDRQTGSISAVDVSTGKTIAKANLPFPNYAGVMSTRGGLVFSGQLDGTMMAHDAETLELLWSMNVGTGFKAPPISFSVNGKQYIGIIAMPGTGVIGGAAAFNAPELANLQAASILWVFSL